MLRPKSSSCINRPHDLKEDLGKTLRGPSSSLRESHENIPLPCPDHEERPSTDSSGSSPGDSGLDILEHSGTSLHELPWQPRKIELEASENFQPQFVQWEFMPANDHRLTSLSQALNTNHSTPPLAISCKPARSIGFSPDVSPTSSGWPPQELDGPVEARFADCNTLIRVNTNHRVTRTNIKQNQPYVNIADHIYEQSSSRHLIASTLRNSDMPAADNTCLPLSVNVPPSAAQYQETDIIYPGPDPTNFTFDPGLDSCDTAVAALPAPTENDFDNAMVWSGLRTIQPPE
ncbi:hypothetical protein PG995_003123 [Apiospora arundinis]